VALVVPQARKKSDVKKCEKKVLLAKIIESCRRLLRPFLLWRLGCSGKKAVLGQKLDHKAIK
jgi:hypothetical protein